MKNNERVNVNITDTDIETKSQAKKRNVIDLIATVAVIFTTILLFLSIAALISANARNNKLDEAKTGEEMLSGILVYGMENSSPFDIVEEAANFKAHEKRTEDEYSSLAVELGRYEEAAFYKYAYEYVGDTFCVDKYQKIMDSAKDGMQVHSYADYIDKNYEKFKNR